MINLALDMRKRIYNSSVTPIPSTAFNVLVTEQLWLRN
jgi:hypothetical protein